jgi:hypothetical protein
VCFCLTCVVRKTHGKVVVCRAPDEKRTANILAHGNLPFSRSDECHTAIPSLDILRYTAFFTQKVASNIHNRVRKIARPDKPPIVYSCSPARMISTDPSGMPYACCKTRQFTHG